MVLLGMVEIDTISGKKPIEHKADAASQLLTVEGLATDYLDVCELYGAGFLNPLLRSPAWSGSERIANDRMVENYGPPSNASGNC
jgi:hypothetical protein